jgi:hypothetical protein
MRLSRDFSEFVGFCEAHEVRYLIIGGYAVGFHGYVRYTKDLGVWVEPTANNAELVLAALDQFGFRSLGLTTSDLTSPDTVIQLGYPPNRIDLLTEPSGVSFEECWTRRERVQLAEELTVNIIGFDDLIVNKRESGRPRDLADIEDLGAQQ